MHVCDVCPSIVSLAVFVWICSPNVSVCYFLSLHFYFIPLLSVACPFAFFQIVSYLLLYRQFLVSSTVADCLLLSVFVAVRLLFFPPPHTPHPSPIDRLLLSFVVNQCLLFFAIFLCFTVRCFSRLCYSSQLVWLQKTTESSSRWPSNLPSTFRVAPTNSSPKLSWFVRRFWQ